MHLHIPRQPTTAAESNSTIHVITLTRGKTCNLISIFHKNKKRVNKYLVSKQHLAHA